MSASEDEAEVRDEVGFGEYGGPHDGEHPASSDELAAATAALPSKRGVCAITGRERPRRQLVRLDALRPALAERIRADHPDLPDDASIGRGEITRYRTLYVEELLREEHGEFTELDRQVADSIAN